MDFFSQELITWYQKNKRDLPWRHTQNPYFIWLSEIILQQTRVKQGLPYYLKFIEIYPTIQDLANAPEEEVLRLWQGLGYYSRARNMYQTARMISDAFEGVFPNNYAELLRLKGIGKYTASAIASFAFDEKVAVLDGNVYRVLARYFGIEEDIALPKTAKIFSSLAYSLLPEQEVATYNQAIMDFGAIQCTPSKPDCGICPLQLNCVAFRQKKQAVLPIKIPKLKIKKRFFHYLVFRLEEKIAMQKRTEKDIWQGLYDFYLVEHTQDLEINDLVKSLNFDELMEDFSIRSVSPIFFHILTHQRLQIKFWEITLKQAKHFQENVYLKNLQFYGIEEIKNLPKPILIANYLEKHFF